MSYPGLPDENIFTSAVFYKRMHGVPELFKSSYSMIQLENLSEHIPEKASSYIYFNNTMFEAGYANAWQLHALVRMQQEY